MHIEYKKYAQQVQKYFTMMLIYKIYVMNNSEFNKSQKRKDLFQKIKIINTYTTSIITFIKVKRIKNINIFKVSWSLIIVLK